MIPASRFAVVAAVSAVLAFLAPGHAHGQIEEIIVTSQKRSEGLSVQDIPVALTAVDEAILDSVFAIDLVDVGRLAPNATLHPASTFTATPNFFIRGIGVSGTTRSLDPAVGIFVDGMYIGYPVGAILDVFDRESVEVLRGPQGTIFGRNVTGGAINVRSKRPTGEFAFDSDVVVGDFNRFDVSASVEGSLVQDRVAGKIALMSRSRDGYWEDNNGGTIDPDVNPEPLPDSPTGTKPDIDLLVVRPMLQFTPTDSLEITLIGEVLRDNSGTANSRNIINPDNPRRPIAVLGYTPPSDPYEINHDLNEDADLKTEHLIAELNWDLGHGVLTSISSWRQLEFDSSTDFDGTPFTIFHFPLNSEEQDQVSQELRYASRFSDNFEFVAGAFYFDQSYFVGERRRILPPALPDQAIVADMDHMTWSVFAEGNVFLNDDWTLTLGGRFTYEEKDVTFGPLGSCAVDFSSCDPSLQREGDWDDFTPKAALKYQINDDSMVYGSWTEGFRSGTFDARARTVDSFLNSSPAPESVTAFEFGYKTLSSDGRLRFNAAIFHNDYQDIQRLALEPVPIEVDPEGVAQRLINAAEATIQGVELELSYIPVENFVIDASLGYVDAGYDEFDGFDADGVLGFDPVTDPAAARALKFERVPELTGYLAGTWIRPLDGGAELSFRASYWWTDEYYNDALNAEIIKQDAYGLIDANVTWTNADGNVKVSLFGRNLADEEFFDFGLDNALTTLTWGGMPRNFGIRLSYSY